MIKGVARFENALRARTVGSYQFRHVISPNEVVSLNGRNVNRSAADFGAGFRANLMVGAANRRATLDRFAASVKAKAATPQVKRSNFFTRLGDTLRMKAVPSAATTMQSDIGLPSGKGSEGNPIMLPEETVLGSKVPAWALPALGVLVLVYLATRS